MAKIVINDQNKILTSKRMSLIIEYLIIAICSSIVYYYLFNSTNQYTINFMFQFAFAFLLATKYTDVKRYLKYWKNDEEETNNDDHALKNIGMFIIYISILVVIWFLLKDIWRIFGKSYWKWIIGGLALLFNAIVFLS